VRKNFPLRIDAEVMEAVRRWADDDLRSLNGQIEFLLREALRKSGRAKEATVENSDPGVEPRPSESQPSSSEPRPSGSGHVDDVND
jgi:hypothetical protein